MSRIVYGVSGEGSGHSSRAREVAGYLTRRGHELWLVSYDRGYRNLKDEFRVFENEGLCIGSEDNKVSLIKTFTENLKRLPEGTKRLQDLRLQVFQDFQPDCVISDFEPMTAYLANFFDLPLISLDNQHRMRYMQYECPPGLTLESQVTKNVIRAMVPRPDVSLVTTFFIGQPTNARTFFFPPIVRQPVRELEPETGEHILVYLTSGFGSFLELLQGFGRESFRVYGEGEEKQEANFSYRPFSKEGFLEDLRTCKAVMATAGFTLISEALYLHKPYLALPMQGQFEQQLNAFQLEQLGYGRHLRELKAEHVGDFLYRLPELQTRLADYDARDGQALMSKLDELLADGEAALRDFHRRRDTL